MWGIREIWDMALVVARGIARSKLSPLVLAFSLLTGAPAFAQLSAGELNQFRAAVSSLGQRSGPPRVSNPAAQSLLDWMYLQRPDNSASFSAYAEFLRAHPDWPRRQILSEQAEKRLNGTERSALVIEHFNANAPQSVKALDAYVRALRQEDQDDAAKRAVKAFWRTVPMNQSEQTEVMTRYRQELDLFDHHMRVDRIISGGFGAADMAARRALANAIPGGEVHKQGNAVRLQIVEAIRTGTRGNISSSQRQRIDQLVDNLPETAQRDTGFVYDYARWLEFSDQPEKAGRVLAAHPTHPHGDMSYAWKVRDMVARDLIERGDGEAAYKVASQHGLTTKDEQIYREAEWLSGWIALRFLGDARKAWDHFDAMYKGSTAIISRARGAYWLGRAAQALGQGEIAGQWYEQATRIGGSTFYGQMAALDRYGEAKIDAPSVRDPDGDERATFNNKLLIEAVRIAHQAGESDLTKSLLLAQANNVKSQAEATLTLKLAKQLGGDSVATFAAKRVGAQGYAVGREGYPTLRGVPAKPEAALIHAIIRQESTFDSQARSPVGALGLMQLMPETAKQQARRMGVRHSTAMLQSNPTHNIKLGSAFLQGLLDNFGGSYILAPAAYNAGPGRAREWVERFGSPTNSRLRSLDLTPERNEPAVWKTIDWIEAIPFNETRNYVMRVNEAVSVYRAILNDGPQPVRLALSRDLRR
jgi:soluble lytic murein transglycosylase